MTSDEPNSLWAHPPLPPGKRVLDRSKSTFGFIRKFPSVRRFSQKENMLDTTYEKFDYLFEDNDIMLVGTEYYDEDSNKNNRRPPVTSLFRSRSDGNLAQSLYGSSQSVTSPGSAEPKGLSKYLRVLSGSWKNLLNSKS